VARSLFAHTQDEVRASLDAILAPFVGGQ
jgi:hypothetical protein